MAESWMEPRSFAADESADAAAVVHAPLGWPVQLSLACGERLRVHRFSVREAISSLFSVQVLARSSDPCVDLKGIVGRPAALRIASGYRFARGGERLWSGLCHHARLVQAVDVGAGEVALSTYEIAIVPRLWLLTQRSDHRVFQHLSIPEIVRRLLEGWGVPATWHLDADDHPRLAYKVQYGETDFDFVSRLLEEAGIAYAFTDDDRERSRLVLSDALHLSAPRREAAIRHVMSPNEAAERELVTRVAIDEHVRPGAVVVRDYDFRRPAFALLGEARHGGSAGDGRLERYRYRPGAFVIERGAGGPAAAAPHDGQHGALLAARALEAERAGSRTISFETNAIDLRPGTVFSMEGHPRPELDPRVGLLITSLSIDGSPDGEWTTRGEAVPADEPYRPPPRTPKPKVHGVQSGVVVGPPGQEIHTDDHGRVRVQLAWDREGTLDEKSSCWLRVSQGWAGAGFGMFALPRVGQEVLVAFLDGDPDQPIVVGRAPNALNPPPVKLPEERTQSAWRSASSPGGDGFNEIRFEDRRGAELVSLHAARDLRARVEQDEATSVGRDRTKTVGGDESARTEGRLVLYVGQDAHVTVEGELRERIGGTRSLTVEADRHEAIAGAAALAAGGEIHIKAGTALVLEGADVTLRGPGGFVRIDGGGVTIDGGSVRIKEGGAPGAGHGAHPALPVVPLRADEAPARRRLPLIAFPPGVLPPMPTRPPGRGGGGPLTPDEATLCGLICLCNADPAPHKRPSDCLTSRLRALDAASGGTSRLKAEVPYDMSKDPPAPVMSRKEPERPSTGKHPKGSRAPDVVIVKDPSKPPTQDNIEEVIEVKFPTDRFRGNQGADYKRIAGAAPFETFGPERCGCQDPERRQEQEATAEDVVVVALLAALVIILLIDDLAPGGQADDAAVPPLIARILSRLAPLLRAPAPVLP
jgi:type VI secretion system secreted protein VgrG